MQDEKIIPQFVELCYYYILILIIYYGVVLFLEKSGEENTRDQNSHISFKKYKKISS